MTSFRTDTSSVDEKTELSSQLVFQTASERYLGCVENNILLCSTFFEEHSPHILLNVQSVNCGPRCVLLFCFFFHSKFIRERKKVSPIRICMIMNQKRVEIINLKELNFEERTPKRCFIKYSEAIKAIVTNLN